MPSTLVATIPPGSSPGIKNFASAPTMSPSTARVKIPVIVSIACLRMCGQSRYRIRELIGVHHGTTARWLEASFDMAPALRAAHFGRGGDLTRIQYSRRAAITHGGRTAQLKVER